MSKKLSVQEKARRIWVRALRSGKYGWGTRSLRPEENKFCCLGVLCEVAVKHGIIKSYNHSSGTLVEYPKVMKWVGLEDNGGDFRNDSLLSLNDDASRNPFKKIADLIERKPTGLFVEEQE